ncbi:GntR family transcriptional regulator [Algirhabdus cladophorae]|uniref:GntR family transcriptional regulator n=1 Tax=Algirhabdus cladophorae TaxID=3377108 RepID=UPI003B8455F3
MAQTAKITRTEDAYARLKHMILEAKLAPGYQALEPEIALELGMSRTPVREALIRLEAEGLVDVMARRGVRVLPIKPSDMAEIYQILSTLEPEAAAQIAARSPSAEELAPLSAATTQMEDALAQKDLETWAAADDLFHRTLLDLHGNSRMRGFVTSLYDQAHRARMVTLRLRPLPVRSTQDHRNILQHMAEGNVRATRRAFKSHRKTAATELLGILETYHLLQL